MERRLLVAIALMLVVAVVPSFIWKPAARRAPAGATADSMAAVAVDAMAAGARDSAPARTSPPPVAVAPLVPGAAPADAAPAAGVRADSVVLETARARLSVTTDGGAISGAVFPQFKSFHDDGPVNLVRPDDRLLVNRLVLGEDTIRLDHLAFRALRTDAGVMMTGDTGRLRVTLTYTPVAGRDFLFDVTGRVDGLEGRGALLLVGLGTGFAQHEADSTDNYRHYGIAVRRTSPEGYDFRKVDPGEVRIISGPFDWVALKSKYFIGAVLSSDSTQPQIGGAILRGMERTGRSTASHAETWVTMPVGSSGEFRYQFYVGPQEFRGLTPLGRKLDRASPYGWIFKPLVMPVAGAITKVLLWFHERLNLAYGWVLVLFGVMVRVVLWPLNQKAMKSQVAMMTVQPLLKEIQDKYKSDPTKQQAEIMKIYKEHKVNPFGGCLPLLLPWPVLLALFFVFANTIELRGVPFLWLPDLAQRDPYYIIPVVMGGSMWALSKLSQVGVPPNPQAKMMTTVMPVMMTVLFLNFASGLNLYYAVSNLVSLPQQYFINKARRTEMAKRQAGVARP